MELEESKLPKHIGIIMDGNRRWAREKGKPVVFGHREGAKTLEDISRYANKIGIEYLTVYAFSVDNWKRSEEEVNNLMIILQNYIEKYSKIADTENIRVKFLGDWTVLKPKMQKGIIDCIERTKNNTGLTLNIALNYGGRTEIIKAIKEIATDVKNNQLKIEEINEETVSNKLYTANQPDPDLIIRTSGEIRTSNFLTWQIAYSELLFINKYWPDFNDKDLDEAIEEYKRRTRRLGN